MEKLLGFMQKLDKKSAIFLAVGILVGVLLFGLVRFAWQPDDSVHYHANFAVFINGQRQQFVGAQYYQEVASCSSKANPQGRVHMHNNVDHTVHVHDRLVTWANFFSVLGWSLDDVILFDGKTAYVNGQGGELHFVLNGKPVRSVANEVIGDEDRLLISYGQDDDAALQKQYDQVPADAHENNETKDPAACRGPEDTGMGHRLQRAFWF